MTSVYLPISEVSIDISPTRVWFAEHSSADFDSFDEGLNDEEHALDLTGMFAVSFFRALQL